MIMAIKKVVTSLPGVEPGIFRYVTRMIVGERLAIGPQGIVIILYEIDINSIPSFILNDCPLS